MIRRFLLAAVAIVAVLTADAQNAKLDALKAEVATEAAKLPLSSNEGMTIDSMVLTDQALEIHCTMAIPAAQFDQVRASFDMMRPTLLMGLTSEADTRKVFSQLPPLGLGFNFFIHSNDDASKMVKMTFTSQELADALK